MVFLTFFIGINDEVEQHALIPKFDVNQSTLIPKLMQNENQKEICGKVTKEQKDKN